MESNKIIKLLIAIAIIVVSAVLIGGFFGPDIMYHIKNRGALGPLSREDIQYQNVQTSQATSKDGTVNASDWQSTYPYIVASMGANSNNYTIVSYLE